MLIFLESNFGCSVDIFVFVLRRDKKNQFMNPISIFTCYNNKSASFLFSSGNSCFNLCFDSNIVMFIDIFFIVVSCTMYRSHRFY